MPEVDPATGVPKFVLKRSEALSLPRCGLVILDEASMLDPSAWADMWRTCQKLGLKIILVGDGFQLPPVTKGNEPFSTMTKGFAEKYGFERVEMVDIVRQALESPIVRAATALRQGDRSGLSHLWQPTKGFWQCAYDTLCAGGVVISHSNVTRHAINNGLKQPQLAPGEPLLVLRNDYDMDVYNGQQLRFEGWQGFSGKSVVIDTWRGTQAHVNFATAKVDGLEVILCPEQIAGTLDASEHCVADSVRQFAKDNNLRSKYKAEGMMPILHANYGYCYTAHKAQGSEWPYALVVIEPTVRLNEEDGLRWAYTAITRASKAAAVWWGRP